MADTPPADPAPILDHVDEIAADLTDTSQQLRAAVEQARGAVPPGPSTTPILESLNNALDQIAAAATSLQDAIEQMQAIVTG
jgi:hypothetical protein